MSRKSARYSDTKNRKAKSQHEADKALHQSKKDHHQKVLETLGLSKICK